MIKLNKIGRLGQKEDLRVCVGILLDYVFDNIKGV